MITMNKNKIKLDNLNVEISIQNKINEETRAFYTNIIKLINKELTEEKEDYKLNNNFYFTLNEISKFLPLKKRKLNHLKLYLNDLQSNLIFFDFENNHSFSINLISYYEIENNNIIIEFPKRIVRAVANPKLEPIIDLVICKSLKNKYSIFMYKYINDNKEKSNFYFTLEDFKKQMYIEAHKYTSFSGLKSKVIVPIMEELQEYYNISLEEIKTKNKTTAIRFIKN